MITEVLDAYPRQAVLWIVPVAESGTGEDMAALIEKYPPHRHEAPDVRTIDEAAIKAHAERRFRSEYDYALFEYLAQREGLHVARPAGVIAARARARRGLRRRRHAALVRRGAGSVFAIDLVNRFGGAGTRLAQEQRITNLSFAQADGLALPFATRRVRRRAVARRHRARARRAALPARVPARAEAGRLDVPLDGALPVVCGRAPAPAEDPDARCT